MLALLHLGLISWSAVPAAPRAAAATTPRAAVRLMADITLPSSPKDVATQASLAVQAALSDGHRRLEVTAPEGLCFFGSQGKQTLGDPDLGVPTGMRERGDRELAYICAEMFSALGDGVAVCLPDDDAVEATRREFAKGGLQARLTSSPTALAPKTGGGGGFGGGGGGGGGAASPLRVVLMVRANKQSLAALKPVVDPLGNEVVVLLVNPQRLKSGKDRKGYVPTFVLRDNPHPEWRGGLLYRCYPGRWALAVAAAGGRVVVHGQSDDKPTLDDLGEGFEKIKDDTSLISQAGGLLSAAGAAAALERR